MKRASKIKKTLRGEAVSHLDDMQEKAPEQDREAARLDQEIANKSMDKI